MRLESEVFELLIDIMKEYLDHKGRKLKIGQENVQLLQSFAVRNKVDPVLYAQLLKTSRKLPGNHGEQFTNTRRLYLKRFEMLKDVIEEFEKKGIKYAVLKGAYLGDVAYGDLSLRKVNDVDILIRKENIKQIKEVCKECGFVPGKADRVNKKIEHYTRKQEIAFARNTHQIATMVKLGNDDVIGFYDTVIDFNFKLSWGEYDGESILADEFLEHTEKFRDSNGYFYDVLKPAYNLVQLCLHAYKEANGLFFLQLNHGMFLRAFLDIYYYIVKMDQQLDSELFLNLVRKYKIQSYVYFILFIIEEIFGREERIHSLIQEVKDGAQTNIIEQFGLEDKKNWNDVQIKERFYATQAVSCMRQQITDTENEKIQMAARDFY